MSARVVELDGAAIRYVDPGEGPVAVLVHGGLGIAADWDPVRSRLEARFRVIAPTSRGHGASSNDGRPLSYPLLADDLAALIAALRLERPTIVGWSDGGQIALELGVRHPGLAGVLVIGGAYQALPVSAWRAGSDVRRRWALGGPVDAPGVEQDP